MNSVNLIGRLSRVPVAHFEGEHQTTTFTLALVEPGHEGKAFTLYVPCVCWGKVAEAAGVLEAEDLVSVQGKLCWRKHIDTHGQEKSAMAVSVREVSVVQAIALPV
jgi:single-stranded DNA-binding protein